MLELISERVEGVEREGRRRERAMGGRREESEGREGSSVVEGREVTKARGELGGGRVR